MKDRGWVRAFVPVDVKQYLEDEAERNCSTIAAEIVRAVRAARQSEGDEGKRAH